jgi:hypothetical protein
VSLSLIACTMRSYSSESRGSKHALSPRLDNKYVGVVNFYF